MDTNKNVAINEFSGGMNFDFNYNTLQHNLYIYGENIRLTSNALINQGENPDKKEGVVSPIPEGILIKTEENIAFDKILAIELIDNICVVVVEKTETVTVDEEEETVYKWSVYRITYNSDKTINVDNIFNSTVAQRNEIPKFSTVINKEVNGIIKLYIADGKNEIMVLNVNSDYDYYNSQITESQLISNNYFPKNKVRIINTISGRLPVGLVQYTYRFYKKYSIKSKLAPLTNKILIINSTKNKEQGNAEDTTTSMGLLLRIDYDEECRELFDKVLVFRIYYKQIDVDADIELIYDEKINTDSTYIKLNDVGKDALKEYTAEEFSLLDGQDIIPQCIEHNQGYMFAANVLDKTIINKELDEFDARAFSANSKGIVVLYADTDTEYQDTPNTFPIDYVDTTSPNAIQLSEIKLYTLNKYADMNIDAIDDEVCRYDEAGFLGGTGRYVSWRFVTTKIPMDNVTSYESKLPPNTPKLNDEPLYYLRNNNGEIEEVPIEVPIDEPDKTIKYVFNRCGVLADSNISYSDTFVSSLMRSLRRNEVYRYGIILYDENGRRSDVNWIADIKTPNANEFKITQCETDSTNQFEGVSHCCVLNGVLNADFTRTGDNLNRRTFETSSIWSSGNFSTEAGQYLYCDSRSFFATSCSVEIFNIGHIWDIFPSEPTKLHEWYLPNVNTNIEDLAYAITDDLYASTHTDVLKNISITLSNITVNFDGNSIPIEEYNNSNNRLLSHANVFIEATVYISFEVTAKNFRVKISMDGFGRGYSSDEKLESLPYSKKLFAKPIGIEFSVKNIPDNIAGYLIVRCAKDSQYRKNIMLCVAALPIHQLMAPSLYSPYYPHYLLTTNPYEIKNRGLLGFGLHGLYGSALYIDAEDPTKNVYQYYYTITDAIPELFQLYSPEITNRRADSLQTLTNAEKMLFFGFAFTDRSKLAFKDFDRLVCYKDVENEFILNSQQFNKSLSSVVTRYYEYMQIEGQDTVEIKQIQDVKNPLWEDAYSNVLLGSIGGGDNNDVIGVTSATKQYKSYVTSIGDKEYVNWICNAMYDIKAFKIDVNKNQHYDGWAIISKDDLKEYEGDEKEWYRKAYDISNNDYLNWFADNVDFERLSARIPSNSGFIGPGPVCFIANVDMNETVVENMRKFDDHYMPYIGTAMVNIQHRPIQYAGLSNSDKTLDVYYGFGNFYTTEIDNQNHIASGSSFVFDGDVYIVPFEIVQMFKTYDFNSDDTLLSALFIYYIPIETPINTYFDYGMNYRNTLSKTLLLEPGEISGVSSQDRPLSQYSMILSDNSTSNDVYNARYNEDETSEFKCRIWFSNQKISGEYIDNWLIYSPLDYTDGDSRFGDITCLTSMKDAIYCWQDRAFGRVSVNERSLVKDTNSNMIQLGTGGVVQRVDYIDTIHGMSPNQYVCEDIANRIFWIDDKNKVVMMSDGTNAVNLSEQTNVQGLLNGKFSNDSLAIGYDSLSDELLCKCLNDGQQLVFNTKLNLATSVYTRNYLETFRMHNELFGINNPGNKLSIYKFGGTGEAETTAYMPSVLLFVVNDNSSITKVFDNQEIVFTEANNDISSFNEHSIFEFDTNTTTSTTQCGVDATYYEGNVRYAVPREQCADYGQRMRGKWLKVSIDLDGSIQNAISHVLTKFRQSF